MERIHKEEHGTYDAYVADVGLVVTSYKDGDLSIMYSETLIVEKGSGMPSGYYTMSRERAMEIERDLRHDHEEGIPDAIDAE